MTSMALTLIDPIPIPNQTGPVVSTHQKCGEINPTPLAEKSQEDIASDPSFLLHKTVPSTPEIAHMRKQMAGFRGWPRSAQWRAPSLCFSIVFSSRFFFLIFVLSPETPGCIPQAIPNAQAVLFSMGQGYANSIQHGSASTRYWPWLLVNVAF